MAAIQLQRPCIAVALLSALLLLLCSGAAARDLIFDVYRPAQTYAVVRMYDYYSSAQVSVFTAVELPKISRPSGNAAERTLQNHQGLLYQTVDGVQAELSAPITEENTTLTNQYGAFVFLPSNDTDAVDLEVDVVVRSYSAADGALLYADRVVFRVASQCDSLQRLTPNWGQNQLSAPAPTSVLIRFNAVSRRFELSATVPYLRDSAAVLVDVVDRFVGDTQQSLLSSSDLRDTTVCSSRALLPAATAYSSLWGSAPTAVFPDALSGARFPDAFGAYPPLAAGWTLTAGACNSVTYATSWTFTDLLSCSNELQRAADNNGVSVVDAVQVRNNGSGILEYVGSVYVNVAVPRSQTDESAGLVRSVFEYPFRFGFRNQLSALGTLESGNDFQLVAESISLDPDTGALVMTLVSTYVPGLITTLTQFSADPVEPLALVSGPDAQCDAQSVAPCTQRWTVSSDPAFWTEAYNGEYLFRWLVDDDQARVVYGAIVVAQQLAPEDQVQLDLGFTSGLRFFRARADWLAGENNVLPGTNAPFVTGDTVFVRDDVVVAVGDEQNFQLSLLNAWLCYTDNSAYVIEVANGKRGCADPFILDAQRAQMMVDGAVNTDPALALFGIQTATQAAAVFQSTGSVATGLVFNAQPIAAAGSRNYTVHFEVEVVQQAQRRRGARSENNDGTPVTAAIRRRVHVLRSISERQDQGTLRGTRAETSLLSLADDDSASPASAVRSPSVFATLLLALVLAVSALLH